MVVSRQDICFLKAKEEHLRNVVVYRKRHQVCEDVSIISL